MAEAKERTEASELRVVAAAIVNEGAAVSCKLSDGRAVMLPSLHLRDLCGCSACRHANGQRLIDLAALPQEQEVTDCGLIGGRLLLQLAPEGHEVSLDAVWLARHLQAIAAPVCGRVPTAKHWDANLQRGDFPCESYAAVASDESRLAGWLEGLRDRGFAILADCGVEEGTVCKAVSLFGFVRETNYGRLFDVVAKPDPNNLAYTGLGLGLHTDNPYRDPVPGLQFLHCLEASGDGGESLLVDGFRVAEDLRRDDPQAFALLTTTPVPFRFRDASADLRSRAPLIETDAAGGLVAVRYNNRSRDHLDLPVERMLAFYAAYGRFGRRLHDSAYAISFKLKAGDLFVVDNRRVLHGRTAFSGGRRRLQGCYADWDAVTSFISLKREDRNG